MENNMIHHVPKKTNPIWEVPGTAWIKTLFTAHRMIALALAGFWLGDQHSSEAVVDPDQRLFHARNKIQHSSYAITS